MRAAHTSGAELNLRCRYTRSIPTVMVLNDGADRVIYERYLQARLSKKADEKRLSREGILDMSIDAVVWICASDG